MKGGVVGLGAKGAGMGQTLLADGHAVAGFDLTADAVARRVALGGRPAGSLAMAVQNADVVVCVGVTTSQTKAVPFGPKGAAAVMAPRRRDPVLRHHGPKVMAPKSARALSVRAHACGFGYLDAAISGGAVRAARGGMGRHRAR